MKKRTFIFIFIISVVIILGVLGIVFMKNQNKMTDSEKFKKEYTEVSSDNVFVYRKIEDIISILENGTGIVYLGFPECPWCQAYVNYLNIEAKNKGVEKIYYFNIKEDREKNTREYQKIVSILKDYLPFSEEGKKRLYVPAVIAVKQGKIVGFDDETSLDTKGYKSPKEYWENEDLDGLKKKFSKMFQSVKLNYCTTDCNK